LDGAKAGEKRCGGFAARLRLRRGDLDSQQETLRRIRGRVSADDCAETRFVVLVCGGRLVLARAHDASHFGKPSVDMRLPTDHWRFAHRSNERLFEVSLDFAREEGQVNAIKQAWLDCVEHNGRGSPAKFAGQLIGFEAAANGLKALYYHTRSFETAGPLGLSWGSWGNRQQGVRFLQIPLWHAEILFASLIAIPIFSWMHARRRIRSNHCPTCGYDLRATPESCPVCVRGGVANEVKVAQD
jgi:hypothetical protein